MIKTFGDKESEKVWKGIRSKKLPNEIQEIARRKLRMMNNAQDVIDLRIPPANRLEKLKGDLDDYYNLSSIIKIGFRPLRNNELRTNLLKIYRDKSKKLCEVNRCLSAEYFFALHKNQLFSVVQSRFSPLNLRLNALTNRFLCQSEFQFYNRTQVIS